ncbi:MAG: DUF4038 domain-containing protein [Rikenellaceae bacterium]
MKTRLISLFALLICTLTSLQAAIKSVDYSRSGASVERFEVLDIKFTVKGRIEKPFLKEANAKLINTNGETKTIPLFYNGGEEWILRFSGERADAWSYTVESELKSLNGKKGKIEVSQKQYMNRRGAIVRDYKYPQHLFWEDGSPYFMMGFECDFLFALDYHNDSATPKLSHFLDGVAQNGFNHIVMNLYANDVVWQKDAKLKQKPQYEVGGDEKIFPFLGSNSKPDYSSLNADFFKKFDRTMEALNERDLISHLMIYVWNKNVNWPDFKSEEDNMYFDYIIKRYQAFSNIVWDISKEAMFYGMVGDDFILERIERVKRLDSYKRLITVHDFGFCNRNKESVDFIAHQNWKLTIYADMLKNHNTFKDKPTFNIEHGGYEESDYFVFCGNYINAEQCLRRNWECAFAGSYSTYYWQGCSWNVLVYDWDSLPEESYRPKMEYFKHMTDFFNSYPYHTFKPVPYLNNSGYVMTDDKDTYLFYLPKESYKCAAGGIMKKAKHLSFQWFNVQTGEYSEVSDTKEMEIFAMPAAPWHMESDAILIIKILEKKE